MGDDGERRTSIQEDTHYVPSVYACTICLIMSLTDLQVADWEWVLGMADISVTDFIISLST